MNAIASYFGKSEPIKNIPKQVEMSKRFLLEQGVNTVSLIGKGSLIIKYLIKMTQMQVESHTRNLLGRMYCPRNYRN